MKLNKIFLLVFTLFLLGGCGSKNNVIPATTNPAPQYNTSGYYPQVNVSPPAGSVSIPGGYEVSIPLFNSFESSVGDNKTVRETLPVVAGDRVVVQQMDRVQQTGTSFPYFSSNLSSVTVKVSSPGNQEVILGTGFIMEALVPVAGNLQLAVDWPLSSSKPNTHTLAFPSANNSGVYLSNNGQNSGLNNSVLVLHCTSFTGTVMPCPPYQYFGI